MTKDESLIKLKELLNYDDHSGKLYWIKPLGRACSKSEAGYINKRLYRTICFNKYVFYAHRVIWFLHYDEKPPEIIDHVNGNTLDNSIFNLRKSNKFLNGRNRNVHRAGQKLGVSFRKDTGKWIAQFWEGDIKFYLGQFNSENEAHKAYLKGREEYESSRVF